MSKHSLLKLKNVSKFYYNKGMVSSGFSKVNLELNLGEFVVITGESGSGKSTLLNVLSGLDSYEEGEMYINGEETSHYSEEDFEKYRKTYTGNIFQSFNLVNSYTVYQNVELVLLLNGFKKKEIKDKVNELIDKVGLSKYRKTKVSKLSGGQKQRVAIARALAKDTPIILADEPTGNLDSASAKSVLKLLAEIAKEKLVIIVTHNYDQVEEYATRKLEMHDGKLREDIVLKETKEIEPTIYEFKDLTLGNKIRLGFRNTFNIPIKFILILIVFLFVVSSFLSEYAGLKQVEYTESLTGYNSYFDTSSDKRIIIKKNDKAPITKEDILSLEKLNNVERVVEDDITLDAEYSLQGDDYVSFWGGFDSIDQIKKVDKGRLPENDYEIVIRGYEYDYYLKYESKKMLGSEFEIYNSFSGSPIDFDHKLTIVGIIYEDDAEFSSNKFYASSKVLQELRKSSTASYASGKVIINNNKYSVGMYSEYSIVPNENLNVGEAYFSKDMDYLCKNEYCKNTTFTIDIDTIYYSETVDLKVKNTYTKNNYKKLTGRDDFDNIWNTIFISKEDYNKLYDKETFQSSIYVDDEKYIYDVEKNLQAMGYDTLVVKDTLTNSLKTIMSVLKIFRVVITVVEFVFLFFISYFVIKLIQKSKNVYYATVRILGGSKKVINSLIRDELLIVFHIAFVVVSAFVLIVKFNIIDLSALMAYAKYVEIKDFVVIYLLLLLMSLLIAGRYSRKLFKSSAMKVYREEV